MGQRMCKHFQGTRVATYRNQELFFIFSKMAIWDIKKSSAEETEAQASGQPEESVAVRDSPTMDLRMSLVSLQTIP